MKEGNPLSLPKGWEIKKLGEIAEIEYGYTDKANAIGDYRYIRITDIDKDGLLSNNEKVYIKANDDAKSFLLKNSDLLMARTGATFAKVLLYEDFEPSIFASYLIRIKFKEQIDNKFYWYFSKSKNYWEQASALSTGAAQPQFNGNALKQVQFAYPKSLPEQQRIVALLDKTFAAIDQAKAIAEQNLKNAKELFESYLQGVFENKGDDWEEKKLGDLCEFTQGIQRDIKLQSETQSNNQVRFLRIIDFTQGNEPPRYIDFPGEKYILKADDISLVRYGASTGFVCRGLEGALANNLFRVIPKSFEKLSNDFLFIYLQSTLFQNVVKSNMNGAAMPAISFGLIKEIQFPIPSVQEQQAIVRQLDALRAETQKLEAVYQKKLDDLEELKKSVLERAFRGEIV